MQKNDYCQYSSGTDIVTPDCSTQKSWLQHQNHTNSSQERHSSSEPLYFSYVMKPTQPMLYSAITGWDAESLLWWCRWNGVWFVQCRPLLLPFPGLILHAQEDKHRSWREKNKKKTKQQNVHIPPIAALMFVCVCLCVWCGGGVSLIKLQRHKQRRMRPIKMIRSLYQL